MAAKLQVKEDINALREDAAKVLQDITKITKHLTDVGVERSGEIKEDLMETLEAQVRSLSEALGTLNKDLKGRAGQADEHVRKNPYGYILAAMGVGALLGKLLSPQQES